MRVEEQRVEISPPFCLKRDLQGREKREDQLFIVGAANVVCTTELSNWFYYIHLVNRVNLTPITIFVAVENYQPDENKVLVRTN